MKKLIILLALLSFSTTAMATTNSEAGKVIKLNDTSATTPVPLEISASPKVNLSYVNPDAATFQYYIIGTYHEGGTKLYASSSSVTKIYNYEFPAGTTKDFTKLPTTEAAAQSEANWLTTLDFKD